MPLPRTSRRRNGLLLSRRFRSSFARSAMTTLPLVIRPELAGDADPIERLHERAFGPGRFARTAFRLREGAPHLLDLSFTALVGTLLVGSVRLTPVKAGQRRRAHARAAHRRSGVREPRHRPGADRALARGGARGRAPPRAAHRRRTLLWPLRLPARAAGPARNAGPGRPGPLPRPRARGWRARGREWRGAAAEAVIG